ncbi:ABC transporter C family member 10 [Hordeum vulgare]|nr:ABC transporter C family member 10 [Hordeum vulgare]
MATSAAANSGLSGQVTERLTRANYILWRAQIVSQLRGAGYFGYVDGATPEPAREVVTKDLGANTAAPVQRDENPVHYRMCLPPGSKSTSGSEPQQQQEPGASSPGSVQPQVVRIPLDGLACSPVDDTWAAVPLQPTGPGAAGSPTPMQPSPGAGAGGSSVAPMQPPLARWPTAPSHVYVRRATSAPATTSPPGAGAHLEEDTVQRGSAPGSSVPASPSAENDADLSSPPRTRLQKGAIKAVNYKHITKFGLAYSTAPFPTKAESSSPPVMSSTSLWCLFHALELGIELLEPPGM